MTILIQTFQTVIVITLVTCIIWLGGRVFGKKAGYRWRKILWLIFAVRLLLPFPIQISDLMGAFNNTEIVVDLPERFSQTIMQNETADNENNVDVVTPESGQVKADNNHIRPWNNAAQYERKITPAGIIAAVWALGAAFMLIMRFIQYRNIKKRCFSETYPCNSGKVTDCLASLKSDMGIKREIEIRIIKKESDIGSSPMLFGYFNTVLMMPDSEYDSDELKFILKHELTHYRKKDLWYKLLIMLVCDIYWFDPLLRLMKKMAFHDVEFVCDEKATGDMNIKEKKLYSNTVLKTMSIKRGTNIMFATRFGGSKKSAKERFENIFSSKSRKAGLAVFSLCMAVVMAGTACVSVKVDDNKSTSAAGDTEETGPVVIDVDNNEKILKIDSYVLPDNYSSLLDEMSKEYTGYKFEAAETVDDYWSDNFLDTAPVVFVAGTTEMGALSAEGKIADLTEALKKKGWLDSMNENLKAAVMDSNGKVYGIPMDHAYAYGIVMNAQLFKNAGMTDENGNPKIPSTWDELAEMASKIKKDTGVAGFCFPAEDFLGAEQFCNIAWAFGAGDLCTVESDGKYKTHLDSKQAIAAMQYIKDLKWKYDALTENPAEENFSTGYEKVANGEAAMFIGANDALYVLTGDGIDIKDISLASLPAGPSGDKYSFASDEVYVVPANATDEEIDMVLTLLEKLGAGPKLNDASKKKIEDRIKDNASGNVPVIKSITVWNDDEITKFEQDTINANANTDALLYEDYFNAVNTSGYLRYGNDMVSASSLFDNISTVLKKVMTDENADVASLMQKANEEWQKTVDNSAESDN